MDRWSWKRPLARALHGVQLQLAALQLQLPEAHTGPRPDVHTAPDVLPWDHGRTGMGTATTRARDRVHGVFRLRAARMDGRRIWRPT